MENIILTLFMIPIQSIIVITENYESDSAKILVFY